MLLLNVLLAVLWMILQQAFTPLDFLVGFALGFVVIFLVQRLLGHGDYGRRMWDVLSLAGFCIWEIVRACVLLARLILNPEMTLRPGIVAVPLDLRSDTGITTLAILINLIPGTLSLDLAPDRSTLYVHAISVRDAESFRQIIKDEFERRIADILPSNEGGERV
jgi:multicomponent Na+:H+ antiporter subunit E